MSKARKRTSSFGVLKCLPERIILSVSSMDEQISVHWKGVLQESWFSLLNLGKKPENSSVLCDRENLALLRCTKYTATSVPEREGGIVHLCGCTTDGIFSLQIHLQPIFLVTIRYCCPLSGGNFLPALSNPLKRWGAITQPGNGCEFHL